jgi:hypothetical protein
MSSKVIGAAIFILTTSLCTFIWLDAKPYQDTVTEIQASTSVSNIDAARHAVAADAARFAECLYPATESFDSLENRACLLEAITKSTSKVGALIGAKTAQRWLNKHQGDQEIKVAALGAIARGRDEMTATKTWAYDGMQRLAAAHDRSYILLLRDGPQNTKNLFDEDARELSHAEFSVQMPEMAARQNEWYERVNASAGQNPDKG